MNSVNSFDELKFFSEVKKRPNLLLGKPSILSLRDFILGMQYAFSACGFENKFKYFNLFTQWYYNYSTDKNGYVCWWNHIMYISGGFDDKAFYRFFEIFENYLKEVHNLYLPEI